MATTRLAPGDADLEILFDPHRGRVTACAVDHASGEPLQVRADVMSLYVQAASSRSHEPLRIWLDPVEKDTDDAGIPWATRFSGENASLRGAAGFDGWLPCILVRGAAFRAVKIHVAPTESP